MPAIATFTLKRFQFFCKEPKISQEKNSNRYSNTTRLQSHFLGIQYEKNIKNSALSVRYKATSAFAQYNGDTTKPKNRTSTGEIESERILLTDRTFYPYHLKELNSIQNKMVFFTVIIFQAYVILLMT